MVRSSGEWPRGTNEFREAGLVAGECEMVDAPNTLVIGGVLAVRLDPSLTVEEEIRTVDVESLRPMGRLGLDQYTLLGSIRRIARPRVDRAE